MKWHLFGALRIELGGQCFWWSDGKRVFICIPALPAIEDPLFLSPLRASCRVCVICPWEATVNQIPLSWSLALGCRWVYQLPYMTWFWNVLSLCWPMGQTTPSPAFICQRLSLGHFCQHHSPFPNSNWWYYWPYCGLKLCKYSCHLVRPQRRFLILWESLFLLIDSWWSPKHM